MATSSRQQVRQIFIEVSELAESDRDAALTRLCAGDVELITRVRALLSAHFHSDAFPASPDVTAAPMNTAASDRSGEILTNSAPVSERPGSHIGPYRLLQQLGEGGFGAVFMAEQETPVKRRVALKIIKLGMDTRQVVARFEQERQALAMMNHPNIAKVFDAGATSTGRPYFVMELCKGEPITDYCDRNNLSIADRLALFVQVCQAIQHAHQKGLIHRDIKPGNILVSNEDGSPSAKVIDFGIAKATASKLTEKTLFTEHAQLIGTPQYMSPEQAEGSLDIDTRTDVYALGVLLYELLTGATPYDAKSLRSAAYAEIQRIIREVEPPRPSTRLSQNIATAANVAAKRHSEPKKLGTLIRGELDWIAMKAIEKNRVRRYDSANDLGMDVQRYLAGGTVLAAPPSTLYRCSKFVRRNKAPVIAATLVALTLVGGLIGTSYGLRQAVKAREAEASARGVAQSEAARALKAEAQTKARADELRMVADFQAQMLAQVDPADAGVKLSQNVRERFDAALIKAGIGDEQRPAMVEAFAGQFSRVNATDLSLDVIDSTILQPAVAAIDRQFADQAVVACTLRSALAERYHDLGLDATAVALERQTLAQRRQILGEEHPDTVTTIGNVGVYLDSAGKLDEVEPFYREALEKSRRVRGNAAPETLTVLANIGNMLRGRGRYAEAEPYFREALDGRRRVLGESHRDTLSSLNDWAKLEAETGKLAEAEAGYRDVLARRRKVLGEDSHDTLRTANDLGVLLKKQGRLPEAIAQFREIVDKYRRLLGEVHPSTLSLIQNLGATLDENGQHAEAEVLLREALSKQQRLLGADHESTLTSLGNLSVFLIGQNKLTEAETMCRETLERRRRTLGENHPETLIADNVMGLVLIRQRKLAEGEPYWRDSLNISRRTLGPGHPDTLVLNHNLASLMLDLEKPAEAEQLFREVIQNGTASIGSEHPTVLSATKHLGELLLDQARNADAAELLSGAEPAVRKAYTGNNERQLGSFLILLGRAQNRIGQRAAAESNLLEANSLYVKMRGPNHTDTQYSIGVLIQFYSKWNVDEPGKGHDAQAAEWKLKLEALKAATQPSTSPSTIPAEPRPPG